MINGFNTSAWQSLAKQVCIDAHGYTGEPFSKQHYNGEAQCLTAYNVHDFQGDKVILARQFNGFFCFRIEVKGEFLNRRPIVSK